MNDLLSQYRKSGSPPPGKVLEADEYVAFGVRDRVQRLRIRSLNTPVNAPGYNILLNVVYDDAGTHFILDYTIMLVGVRGRNLAKIVFGIENGQVDFIQQFDPTRWHQPTDAGSAVIESITIKIKDGGSPDKDATH